MSPTLFSIFINNLAVEVNNKRCGITIDGKIISILLYADDIVIIAETDENLQIMFNVVNSWCDKWQLQVNEAKSKIVHFRPKQAKLSTFNFKIGPKRALGSIINKYKRNNYMSYSRGEGGQLTRWAT